MDEILRTTIPLIEPELLQEIKDVAILETVPANTLILNDDSYIKVIPIVVTGQVKVYRQTKDKELLLYYIEPTQSCIMSVSASIMNQKSQVKAVTETETTLILIPMQFASVWMSKYPKWTSFVMQLSNIRFEELLDTIDAISFGKLDARLVTYLIEKSKKTNTTSLKITHQTIAEELGSAREVISRLLKQLEKDSKVNLSRGVVDITGLL